MSQSLLLVGSIGIDTLHTPQGSASHQLGGSATFAALAIRHWTRCPILAAIGGDFPEDLYHRLEHAGINLSHLTKDIHAKSFRWEGQYDEGLGTRKTVGIELGVMGTHRLHVPDLSHIKFAMMGNYHPLRELEVIEKLPAGCFICVDTIHGWINHEHANVQKLFSRATMPAIDKAELLELTKTADEMDGVKTLFSWGAQWVIVKYGAQGSRLYSPDGRQQQVGIYDTPVKDTTGAGDTYLGTIMAHLNDKGRADFETIVEGMRLGSAAASITVEAFGVEAIIRATRAQIEERAQKIKEAVAV